MNFRILSSYFSYLLVGFGSLLLAVFLSSKLVRSAHSQSENVNKAVVSGAAGDPDPAIANATGNSPAQGQANGIPQINYSFLEPFNFVINEMERNPFRPPSVMDNLGPGTMVPGTPLENFEIEELKLAGIMWNVKAPKAMIVDPQGEVHVLGKDDRIGRKRGYIAAIREGEVVIVETTTFNGESTYATRIMKIDN